ncbi:hypothetical protein L195_g044998, partial [Trifolium pratense]
LSIYGPQRRVKPLMAFNGHQVTAGKWLESHDEQLMLIIPAEVLRDHLLVHRPSLRFPPFSSQWSILWKTKSVFPRSEVSEGEKGGIIQVRPKRKAKEVETIILSSDTSNSDEIDEDYAEFLKTYKPQDSYPRALSLQYDIYLST